MLTICVNCVHHQHKVVNPVDPNVWYNHRCGHPEVQRPPGVDPVTGEVTYGVDESPSPYCRNINDRGNCPWYQEKDNVQV